MKYCKLGLNDKIELPPSASINFTTIDFSFRDQIRKTKILRGTRTITTASNLRDIFFEIVKDFELDHLYNVYKAFPTNLYRNHAILGEESLIAIVKLIIEKHCPKLYGDVLDTVIRKNPDKTLLFVYSDDNPHDILKLKGLEEVQKDDTWKMVGLKKDGKHKK